jgi:hypothetical protein
MNNFEKVDRIAELVKQPIETGAGARTLNQKIGGGRIKGVVIARKISESSAMNRSNTIRASTGAGAVVWTLTPA